MGRRRSIARWTAALAVLSVFASSGTVTADTRSELERARDRLEVLEGRITSQEASVADLGAQLQDAASAVAAEEAVFDRLGDEAREVWTEVRRTRAEIRTLERRISAKAREIYMHGPGTWFDLVLGAESMADLTRRAVYIGELIRADSHVAEDVERDRARLEDQEALRTDLLREQARELRRVERTEEQLERVFERQQEQLASLARDRAEARTLIEELRGRLQAEALGPAIRAAGRGMPITFGEWGRHFLRALGAPVSHNNLVAVVAWQTAEYTTATWNPLATTYRVPGTTVMNSHGVRNYTSLEQGVQASIATLHRPGHRYDAVIQALMSDADPMTTARAINASDWCRGCANGTYVIRLIPAVSAYLERYAG